MTTCSSAPMGSPKPFASRKSLSSFSFSATIRGQRHFHLQRNYSCSNVLSAFILVSLQSVLHTEAGIITLKHNSTQNPPKPPIKLNIKFQAHSRPRSFRDLHPGHQSLMMFTGLQAYCSLSTSRACSCRRTWAFAVPLLVMLLFQMFP